MILQDLYDKKMITPPKWILTNTCYLTAMGSVAYGVSSDTSDYDLYGFCIPPKNEVFPHLTGEILGFDSPKNRFEQWQKHGIFDQSAMSGHGRTYDFTVFGIVKLFSLAAECNPNVLDSLFTPASCVLHSTEVGTLVRENRRIFLHKGAYSRFKGYAISQLHKIDEPARKAVKHFETMFGISSTNYLEERLEEVRTFRNSMNMNGKNSVNYHHMSQKDLDTYEALLVKGNDTPKGKRKELVEKFGYDVKFAYHNIRLLDEIGQIMVDGDMDLQNDKEELKAIRRGEWTEEKLREITSERERELEKIYINSKLRQEPDMVKIKALLMKCLESHYGNLENVIPQPERTLVSLRNIRDEIDKISHLI